MKSVDSIRVTRSLFQEGNGGSIPTSTLQLQLKQITNNRALDCYEKWHYLGKTKFIATYNFGVFTDGDLWGCISFGSPNAKVLKGYYTPETQGGWYEIKRFALSDTLPKNSESRVISISIKLLRKITKVVGIITYADSGVGHSGIIYKASGFKYLGLTAPKTDFWSNGKVVQRGKVVGLKGEWKKRSQKHLFIKLFKN